MPDEDFTFVAEWKKAVNVTFDYNDGGQNYGGLRLHDFYGPSFYREIGSYMIKYPADSDFRLYETDWWGNTVAFGNDLYMPGARFLGWQKKGDTSGKLYQCDEIVQVKEDTTFAAQWGKLGDVDADGEFTVADLVAVQRWLLGEDIHPAQLLAADLYTDDGFTLGTLKEPSSDSEHNWIERKINIFDLAYMKRELLKQQS